MNSTHEHKGIHTYDAHKQALTFSWHKHATHTHTHRVRDKEKIAFVSQINAAATEAHWALKAKTKPIQRKHFPSPLFTCSALTLTLRHVYQKKAQMTLSQSKEPFGLRMCHSATWRWRWIKKLRMKTDRCLFVLSLERDNCSMSLFCNCQTLKGKKCRRGGQDESNNESPAIGLCDVLTHPS